MYNIAMKSKTHIPKARDLALKVHGHEIVTTVSGLKRPKILHIQQVADFVLMAGGNDDEIASAWLHDTVEDSDTTIELIKSYFGEVVAEIVSGLTDPTDYKGLPLLERKQLQANRLLNMSNSIKLIKLADQTSNLHALALDPTGDMTQLECKDYALGANIIAKGCSGISPELDKLFEKVFGMCMERYGEEK